MTNDEIRMKCCWCNSMIAATTRIGCHGHAIVALGKGNRRIRVAMSFVRPKDMGTRKARFDPKFPSAAWLGHPFLLGGRHDQS